MMKEFFKKNWKLVSIISAAAVAVIVTVVVLCVCLIPSGKSKLNTPENLSISTESVLTWNEVENAENGYTVKIGSDESTTVNTNSLDLATVTAKLKDGENKISVKANATEAYDESEYSAEVTYNYDATPAFATPAAPTINGRTVSWTAVDGATNGYTVKVGDKEYTASANSYDLNGIKDELLNGSQYSISVKVNATSAHKASEYSAPVSYTHALTPAEEAASFIKSVNDIGATVTLDSKEAIALAKTKYGILKDNAQVMAVDGVSAAVATLKSKDTAYYGLLADLVVVDTNWSATTFTLEDKQEFESAYGVAKTYYEGLIDTSATDLLSAKKTAYDDLLTAMASTVEAFESTVNEAIKDYTQTAYTKDSLTQDRSDLTAKKGELEALTDYAQSLLTNKNLSGAIDTQIEVILKIPVGMEATESSVYINRDHGANSVIYVTVTYKNILDEVIEATAAPTITIDGVEDENGEHVEYKEAQKCYVYTVAFTCPEVDGTTTVTYKIGNGETVTKTVKYPSSIITYNLGTNKFMSDNGTLTCYGATAGTPLYADVYAEDAINASATHDEDISVNAAALATIQISNGMTEDALKTAIARKILGENLKLRLVIYELTDDGVYSAVNSCSVSEVLTYTLTEEDKLERIPFTVVNGALEIRNDGSFICGSDFNAAAITAVFNAADVDGAADVTESNVRDYVRYHVYVYKNGTAKGSFYANIPGDATLDVGTIKRHVYNLCGETTASDGITLRVAIALKEDSAFDTQLRESLISPDKDWNFTATIADTRFTGNGLNNVVIGATESTGGSIGYGSWEWANWENSGANPQGVRNDYAHDYHDGLAILVFDATGIDNAATYDFVANGINPFATYTHKYFSEAPWSEVNAAIDAVWEKLPAEQRIDEKYFVFASMVIANEAGIKAGYSNSLPKYYVVSADDTATHAVVKYNRNFSVPTGNQVWFSTNGYLIFARNNGAMHGYDAGTTRTDNESGNGKIFDKGITCIEIKFEKGAESYSAYLFKGDDGLYIYNDEAKTNEGRYCNPVADGGIDINVFNTWVKSNYPLIEFDAKDGWEFSSMVHHDGSYYVGANSYSAKVTYKQVNPDTES